MTEGAEICLFVKDDKSEGARQEAVAARRIPSRQPNAPFESYDRSASSADQYTNFLADDRGLYRHKLPIKRSSARQPIPYRSVATVPAG
jgi:hypothetical protein